MVFEPDHFEDHLNRKAKTKNRKNDQELLNDKFNSILFAYSSAKLLLEPLQTNRCASIFTAQPKAGYALTRKFIDLLKVCIFPLLDWGQVRRVSFDWTIRNQTGIRKITDALNS